MSRSFNVTILVTLSYLVIFFLFFVAVLLIFRELSKWAKSAARQQQISNNSTATQTTRAVRSNPTNSDYNDDNPSLRMKVLNTIMPRQQRIQKGQMVYDSEVQSYRYHHEGVAAGANDITSCALCLENFKEGDVLMMGLCQHVYHRKCCMDWIVKQNSCPLCRKKMFDETTYKIMKTVFVETD